MLGNLFGDTLFTWNDCLGNSLIGRAVPLKNGDGVDDRGVAVVLWVIDMDDSLAVGDTVGANLRWWEGENENVDGVEAITMF